MASDGHGSAASGANPTPGTGLVFPRARPRPGSKALGAAPRDPLTPTFSDNQIVGLLKRSLSTIT